MPINVYLNKYTTPLIKDDKSFDLLKEKYPELEIDLVSARDNQNCSCFMRVKAFLEVKYFIDKIFLDEIFFAEHLKEKYHQYDQEIEAKRYEQNIKSENFKKIHIIKNDQKSWEEFQQFVKLNVKFQSFSVTQDGDNLKIYFL